MNLSNASQVELRTAFAGTAWDSTTATPGTTWD